jgi:hypothetical protein
MADKIPAGLILGGMPAEQYLARFPTQAPTRTAGRLHFIVEGGACGDGTLFDPEHSHGDWRGADADDA